MQVLDLQPLGRSPTSDNKYCRVLPQARRNFRFLLGTPHNSSTPPPPEVICNVLARCSRGRLKGRLSTRTTQQIEVVTLRPPSESAPQWEHGPPGSKMWPFHTCGAWQRRCDHAKAGALRRTDISKSWAIRMVRSLRNAARDAVFNGPLQDATFRTSHRNRELPCGACGEIDGVGLQALHIRDHEPRRTAHIDASLRHGMRTSRFRLPRLVGVTRAPGPRHFDQRGIFATKSLTHRRHVRHNLPLQPFP